VVAGSGQTLDRDFARECGYEPDTLPCGALLCVVNLWHCEPMPAMHFDRWLKQITGEERQHDHFAPSLFAWHVQVMRIFPTPKIVPGKQGLWDMQP
jgi:hypothetical protein